MHGYFVFRGIEKEVKRFTEDCGWFMLPYEHEKGKPKGIVTEKDLVNKVIVGGLDPAKTSVSEIMSTPLITVDPEDDLLKASQVMKEKNVRKLIVIRDEIIYGIITAKIISQNVQDYVDRSIRDIVRWTASLGI